MRLSPRTMDAIIKGIFSYVFGVVVSGEMVTVEYLGENENKTRYHDLSGEELYQLFLGGDMDAFEAIVLLYEDELGRFIYKMVEDYHESKQLTIETFGQLAISGKKFEGKASLKTYLFTIGKNRAVRCLKLRRKHGSVSFDEIVEVLCSGSQTPDAYMEQEENKRLLHEAMSELKEDHRTVLTLLYFEDMTYRQIGKAMCKSEPQVRQLIYRAKAALKRKLEKKEVDL